MAAKIGKKYVSKEYLDVRSFKKIFQVHEKKHERKVMKYLQERLSTKFKFDI